VKITRSIKQTDLGNHDAKIKVDGVVVWSNSYGKRLHAEMAITRNMRWIKQKYGDAPAMKGPK
jgi:hypothetical protein